MTKVPQLSAALSVIYRPLLCFRQSVLEKQPPSIQAVGKSIFYNCAVQVQQRLGSREAELQQVAREVNCPKSRCFPLHLYHIPGHKPCSCSFFTLHFTSREKRESSCNIFGRCWLTVAQSLQYFSGEMAEPLCFGSGSSQLEFSQGLAGVFCCTSTVEWLTHSSTSVSLLK